MKKRNFAMLLWFTAIALIVASGCNPLRKYEKAEEEQIETYLLSRGDTVYLKKPSGLYYFEIEEGTGRMPVTGDTVSFRYKARLLDGTLFDSNITLDEPFSFIVGWGTTILGIDEGVTYMKDGGKAKILTPSFLAYGTQGIWGILPGYTPIVWDIELVSVKAGSK